MVLNDWKFLPPLLILLEFMILALLGYFLVQLIQWEAQLQHNRATWLVKMRKTVNQLRALRRQLDQSTVQCSTLPLNGPMRKKWNLIRWIGKAFSVAKWARP